ncbi:MAG: hypothetical protein KGH68_01825, partial [Patescibacteria group bacterium]|nr:hypothetical protein [Patescibacteria group bacterium]
LPVRKIFFGALFILFTFGFAVTIWLYADLGVPAGRLLMAIGERDISVSHFFHTHVLKYSFGVLAPFLSAPLRLTLEARADFGAAFVGILPTWIGWTGFLGFIILIPSGIAVVIDFVKAHKRRFWIQALFIVVLLSATKNAFDGGLLEAEAMPALAFLWILIFRASTDSTAQRYRRLVPCILLALPFVAALIGIWAGAIAPKDALTYVEHVSGFIFIYGAWLALSTRQRAPALAVACLIVGAFAFIPITSLNVGRLSYASEPIAYHQAYLGTYDPSAGERFGTFVEKIGGISIYDIATSAPLSVGDVLRATGDVDSHDPVAFQTALCAGAAIEPISMLVASKEPLVKPVAVHRFGNVSRVTFLSAQNGWSYYSVLLEFYPCAPRRLDLERELIQEAGARHAVLMPSVAFSHLIY